jgi:hypothetical protein
MATKKTKNKVSIEHLMEHDETLIALKERYFRLLKNENIPHTKSLTDIIDKMETTIRDRMSELQKS